MRALRALRRRQHQRNLLGHAPALHGAGAFDQLRGGGASGVRGEHRNTLGGVGDEEGVDELDELGVDVGDLGTYDFKPVATTDIVSAPRDFLNPDEPTVLVSFARSGNSPESLAAVEIAGKFVKNVRFLNITCAPEGRLAVESADDPRALTLLIPRANDKGFKLFSEE